MKGWKIFLGIGISVVLIGIIVFIIGLWLNGWKFTVEYETKTYNSVGEVAKLDLNLSAGEMSVEFYDGDTVEVTYPDSFQFGYAVSEEDGELTLSHRGGTFIWFGLNKIPPITVKIPNGKVVDLECSLSAGKARIADGEFKNFRLSLSAGTTTVGKIKCGSCDVKLSAGSVHMSGAECGTFSVKLSAGSVSAERVKSDKIGCKLSAGSVSLGVIGEESAYSVSVDKSAGSCNLHPRTGTDAGKTIDVDLSVGSVNIGFTD